MQLACYRVRLPLLQTRQFCFFFGNLGGFLFIFLALVKATYWILCKVKEVIGPIELDVASDFRGNTYVKADRYFTKEDNALKQEWLASSIFMNPPFGCDDNNRGYCGLFVRKFLDEYKQGHFQEGIALLPINATAHYFFDLVGVFPACFFHCRVGFIRPGSTRQQEREINMNGTMLVYAGEHVETFTGVMQTIPGLVILPGQNYSTTV